MTIEEQFAQQIDCEEGRDGRVTEYVYADWLDGQLDPRAEAWRVLIEKKRMPRLIMHRKTNRESWRWYKYKYVFVPKESQLGKDYFLELPNIGLKSTVVWCSTSYFLAMDAAATAWVRVERDPDFRRLTFEPIPPPENPAYREMIEFQQRAIALAMGVPASIVNPG